MKRIESALMIAVVVLAAIFLTTVVAGHLGCVRAEKVVLFEQAAPIPKPERKPRESLLMQFWKTYMDPNNVAAPGTR